MNVPRTVWLAVLLASTLLSAQAVDDRPVLEWVRSAAVRLQTVEAGHGFADLQPLKKTIGNARIVALGEATHGTREFFQLKHRMLEFLATEMGFRVFSIEANMPEAYRLNDFVLTGKGDPAALLRGLYFWTWDTEEVLDMIRWMRRFNESGRGRVEFTGFDMQTPTVAMEVVRDFVAKHDQDYLDAVLSASNLASAASLLTGGPNFGVATGTFPVKVAAGKRVRFSGSIKTEGVTRGWAGLWWRVDGSSGVLAFDNMQNRGATGTTDWKRYELELPVAVDARNINFGVLHAGNGTAWFDALAIELDDVPYRDDSLFDLDFESAAPKNLRTSGNGYRIQLDPEVFRNGRQSLQMAYVAPQDESGPVDAKVAAASWIRVVQHLDAARSSYRSRGVAVREADWAIQSARIVLQGMQMRSNEVSRDRSMADNVKWIVDRSRGAKVVLWAHNGHVATAGESMGSALRKRFGDQMVVAGFAFNQGSFQAISPGQQLRQFTVPAAPPGSLDATLAAAEIPLFAIDLRQAPRSGPVAAWMNEPHKSRSIGAMYSEQTPDAYMIDVAAREWFDVILFVDKTAAARRNMGK